MGQQPETRQDQTAPQQQPISELIPQPSFVPTRKRPLRWRWLPSIVVVALLVVTGGGLYVVLHHQKAAPAAVSSLTLLYSDGKTVLWRSTDSSQTSDKSAVSFAHFVQHELQRDYPAKTLKSGAWRVVTTLDHTLQQNAKVQLAARIDALNHDQLVYTAMVAESAQTGNIISWVSNSPDSTDVPTTRQAVGSFAIPLAFVGALNADPSITAATTYGDAQMPLLGWPCTDTASPDAGGNCLYDQDRVYRGTVTLAQALGGLRNVPTINAAVASGLLTNSGSEGNTQVFNGLAGNDDGFACYEPVKLATEQKVIQNADRSDETACGGAAFIGDQFYGTPADTLAAYATLANEGQPVAQTGIKSVTQNNKPMPTLPPTLERAVSAKTAQTVNGVLADPSVSVVKDSRMFMVQNSPVSVAIGMDDAGTQSDAMVYAKNYVVGAWAYGNTARADDTNRTLAAAYGWLSNAVNKD